MVMFCHRPINIKSVITPRRNTVNRYISNLFKSQSTLAPKLKWITGRGRRMEWGLCILSEAASYHPALLIRLPGRKETEVTKLMASYSAHTCTKTACPHIGDCTRTEICICLQKYLLQILSLQVMLFDNLWPRAGPHPAPVCPKGQAVPLPCLQWPCSSGSLSVGTLNLTLYSLSVTFKPRQMLVSWFSR